MIKLAVAFDVEGSALTDQVHCFGENGGSYEKIPIIIQLDGKVELNRCLGRTGFLKGRLDYTAEVRYQLLEKQCQELGSCMDFTPDGTTNSQSYASICM